MNLKIKRPSRASVAGAEFGLVPILTCVRNLRGLPFWVDACRVVPLGILSVFSLCKWHAAYDFCRWWCGASTIGEKLTHSIVLAVL
jgi:hypothetical protein